MGFRTQRMICPKLTCPPSRLTMLAPLEVLLEVQAGVHARHLIAVPVEHLGFVGPEECGKPALGPLTPAWMVDVWIHIRVEAVLVGRGCLPRVDRLLFDE